MSRILYNYFHENVLTVRCIGDEEELKECFEGLIERNFAPLNFGGHLMRYSYGRIEEAEGYRKLVSQERLMEQVVTLHDMDREVRQAFLEKHQRQAQMFAWAEKQSVDSYVFLQNSEIACITYVVRISEDEYAIPIAYINKAVKYEFVVPVLLAATVFRLGETAGKNIHMLICPSYEKGYTGFMSVFGTPEYETMVHDYSLVFIDKKDNEESISYFEDYNKKHENKEDPFGIYYGLKEMCWISAAVARRIPFVADIRKMPQTSFEYSKKEIHSWLDRWELPYLKYWKHIVFDCGRVKGVINSLSIENIYNSECAELFENAWRTGKLPEFERLDCTAEDIEVCLLQPDDVSMYEILPEHLKSQAFDQKMIIVAAFTPQHEAVGIAVTSLIDRLDNLAYLKYAYVLPELDTAAILSKMINASIYVAKKRGAGEVYLKSLYKEDGVDYYNLSAMVEGNAVQRMEDTNWLVCYNIRDVLNGRLPEVMRGQEKNLPRVDFDDNPDMHALKIFQLQCWEKGYAFDVDNYDQEYTGFIYDGSRIVAAVFANQVSDRELFIRDVFVTEQINFGLANIALIGSVLRKAASEMSDSAVVVLRFNSKNAVDMVAQLVGKHGSVLAEKEYFYKILDLEEYEAETDFGDFDEEADEDVDAFDWLEMPEDLSILRSFTEKLRLSKLLSEGQNDMEYFFSMLLDVSSQMPGNKICDYIRGHLTERAV